MMPGVSVRQATAADDLDVVSVKRAAIRDGTGDAYAAEQVAAWAPGDEEREDYAAAVESDRYMVLVAEIGEDVVGFGVLNVEDGSLLALYIEPARRGTGIGSTLLGHIETSASMYGADSLDLLASHNAVGFYADQGYEQSGTVERDIDGESLEFVKMEKAL
jgi:ribosomal protein S18 acetylase RimI-like enzyme